MNTRERKRSIGRTDWIPAVVASLLLTAAAPPEAPVADAAERGDVEAVRVLLREGADVNAAQGDGMTALHWAAERGDAELTELLVYAGANVVATTRLGDYTPLHLAAAGGHDGVVSALLEAGTDPGARTSSGTTSLHLAARTGSVPAVDALLTAGAEVDAREDTWGQTPLVFAASFGRTDAARALVAAGADLSVTTNVVDVPERSELDAAAGEVRDRVLATFREQSPDPDTWRPSPSQVQAAVRAAVRIQETGTIPEPPGGEDPRAALLRRFRGEYDRLVGTQGGLTPLLHAVREGHAATALALVEAGADVNQQSAGDGTAPLLMATINGHFDLALELMERGADPNLASDAGATPLYSTINTYWAPRSRYPQQQAYQFQQVTYLETMEALLEAGADPNARLEKHLWYMEYTFAQLDVDTRGATPFWRAAHATDVDAMRLLIAHGADPNVPTLKPPERRRGRGGSGDEPDPSGLPPVPEGGPHVFPIHAATGHAYGLGFAGNSHRHAPEGWMPSVRYLVEELGADVSQRDADGNTPLHNAAARGDNELILYLVEKGADVMAVNRKGQTTVDMANGPAQRLSPFPKTIELLEGLGAVNNHNCVGC